MHLICLICGDYHLFIAYSGLTLYWVLKYILQLISIKPWIAVVSVFIFIKGMMTLELQNLINFSKFT